MPGRFDGFEILGYTTWDDVNTDVWVREIPDGESIESIRNSPDPSEVEGVWIHVWTTDSPDDEFYKWVRTYTPLDTWDDWSDLIDLAADRPSE